MRPLRTLSCSYANQVGAGKDREAIYRWRRNSMLSFTVFHFCGLNLVVDDGSFCRYRCVLAVFSVICEDSTWLLMQGSSSCYGRVSLGVFFDL
jgi:hypothetical protein